MISTVHLLRGGKPLCGFSNDYPRDWPSNNKWQPFDFVDGGLAGELGILTMEIEQPEKWQACRGCVKGSLDVLESKGWERRDKTKSAIEGLLESLGLPFEIKESLG